MEEGRNPSASDVASRSLPSGDAEKRFRALFDQLPAGAALVSPDFRFLEINKAYCEIVGYSREELSGLTFVDISHPGELDTDLALARQLLEGRIDQYEMEKRFIRKDGGIAWVRLIVGGIRDEEGRLVNYLATLEDITRRRDTEEALRESEARFRTFLEILPECFAILRAVRDEKGRTVDFRCEYLNEAALQMIGLVRGEALGNHLDRMFPGVKKSVLMSNFLLTLKRNEPLVGNNVVIPGDFPIRNLAGRTFDIHAARLGDGLVVSWTDVTERRESEEALRRKAEELETVLESVPALVWITNDPEASHIEGNRAADAFLRVDDGAEVSLTAPEGERPSHYRAMKDGREMAGDELPMQRAARGEAVIGEELDIRFDDGEVRNMIVNANPLYDREGRPRGSVAAYMDITDRRRMEGALRASLEEKDNLLRELSHRTKNNMQVIESLLGLQSAKSEDPRVTKMLADARSRIRAMALVHEKLYKSGSATVLKMKDYIRDLVISLLDAGQEVPGAVEPILELEDVSLSLDAAVPCGLIINELVSNSLKHAFGEKKVGTIFLALRRDREEVELRYGDDGPGLPRDMDLFQVESLGLKLVHNLAERQLRGRLELRSGARTEFVFRFRDFDLAKRL